MDIDREIDREKRDSDKANSSLIERMEAEGKVMCDTCSEWIRPEHIIKCANCGHEWCPNCKDGAIIFENGSLYCDDRCMEAQILVYESTIWTLRRDMKRISQTMDDILKQTANPNKDIGLGQIVSFATGVKFLCEGDLK